MDRRWSDPEAADLAWRQVITVMESVVPPEVFRPAQTHCWEHKPALPSATELASTVGAFATDAAFRGWVQGGASFEEVFTLWSAIGDLNRAIYLLDEGEKAPKEIVDAVREAPGSTGDLLPGASAVATVMRRRRGRDRTGEGGAVRVPLPMPALDHLVHGTAK